MHRCADVTNEHERPAERARVYLAAEAKAASLAERARAPGASLMTIGEAYRAADALTGMARRLEAMGEAVPAKNGQRS